MSSRAYLDSLRESYPNMPDWQSHPWNAILFMARMGLIDGIDTLETICNCISGEGQWQEIANIGAKYGHMNIVQMIANKMTNIDWDTVAIYARSAGHSDIAEFITGYGIAPEPNREDDFFEDDFEQVIGADVLTSETEPYVQWDDETEDKGKWDDYREQDYKEDFFPQGTRVDPEEDESYEL